MDVGSNNSRKYSNELSLPNSYLTTTNDDVPNGISIIEN